MKKILLLSGLLMVLFSATAQVPSPHQFLGYPVGTHFTPSYQVDNYFKAVAAAKPDMVKVEKYGQTYEGRELLLAFISLPENLARLEEIRKNNLRLTGILNDGVAAQTTGVPAILWLSYNVHGNEPSSSEAAMLTLHALATDSIAEMKDWLKNLVIIIDPVENPDGRDRYVNWYNSVAGTHYYADPQAREHQEPWPMGRTNHYNFDLNRDWAWQTQVETVQRLKKYQQWMPQVHVDYHEQGANSPYYFAPAAEPYHEVITQWQRDFQVTVGKNNARYFDKNGWLYFTRERFDLFYPSYGDTYPLYNGAVGMTYEQGGIGAGLGIRLQDDDTLTLVDRARHHFTTGIATVETAAKNAGELVSRFKKFFDNAQSASDASYKTYVLTAKNRNQLAGVAELLDKNGITYGVTTTKNFKGYNYFSGKEEDYKDDGYQLAVSAFQPRGTLLKVLFEPKSTLKDSVTYDITAWSVPYAYNIKTYGVKDRLQVSGTMPAAGVAAVAGNYGLLIPYTSFGSSQVLAYLLAKGVKVRYASTPFTYNKKNYSAGTLIVLRGNNVDNWNSLVNEACAKYQVQPEVVESGFVEKGSDFGSSDVRYVKAPKVAMLTGEGVNALAAGEVWHLFDQTLQYPLTLLLSTDLEKLDLSRYTTLILPDGSYKALGTNQAQAKLHQFVQNGGKLIAMEDAIAHMSSRDWDISMRENHLDSIMSDSDYHALKVYGSRERSSLSETIIGAVYQLNMDTTHPLAYGYPHYYYTLKTNSNVVNFLKEGWNVGVIKKAAYTAGFVGSKLKPQLKDAMVFGVQNEGRGTIVYLNDDPLFRLFWEGGKMLFCNAVFLVGQ